MSLPPLTKTVSATSTDPAERYDFCCAYRDSACNNQRGDCEGGPVCWCYMDVNHRLNDNCPKCTIHVSRTATVHLQTKQIITGSPSNGYELATVPLTSTPTNQDWVYNVTPTPAGGALTLPPPVVAPPIVPAPVVVSTAPLSLPRPPLVLRSSVQPVVPVQMLPSFSTTFVPILPVSSTMPIYDLNMFLNGQVNHL